MLNVAYCVHAARAAQARRVGRRLASRPEVVPAGVQDEVGYALFLAQRGGKHIAAKPLKGLGAGVVEVVADHRGDTFRAVYTVRLADCVYVLHAFQKKSKHGIATPQAEIDLIKRRLKQAIAISEGKE